MKISKLFYDKSKYSRIWLMLGSLLLIIFLLLLCHTSNYVSASTSNNNEIRLSEVVMQVIDGISFGELNELVEDLDTLDLFNGSIKDKVVEILNGEFSTNYSSVIKGFISIFLVDIREFLPFIFTILAIGILASLINEFKNSSDTSDIIHFVCMSVMIITIIFVFKDVLALVSTTLGSLLKQMKILFPILLALMTSIGSFSSIAIYNPLVAVLTAIVGFVFEKLLYPIFIVVFVLAILGNLTDTVKLNKLQGFLTSVFKWAVGIVFTLFTGFLSIQGITAGRYDSVSIKATKFAVKSYIPIIGSYISDGMDFLVLGSVLVKNTIGLVGFFILFLTIISPIVSIVIVKLGLQLCGAILEMCGSKKLSEFSTNCSKLLIMPIVIILGVAFMYLITIALIMCTANIF